MKINRKIAPVLFAVAMGFGAYTVSAQSCKKAYLSAKEQYNGGRYESAQSLLNACIQSFDANTNQDQVFMFYKLYIASCTENRDQLCADTKRQALIAHFSNAYTPEQVLSRLRSTSF